eukprot:5402154-Prymnesium_polylepis.1
MDSHGVGRDDREGEPCVFGAADVGGCLDAPHTQRRRIVRLVEQAYDGLSGRVRGRELHDHGERAIYESSVAAASVH